MKLLGVDYGLRRIGLAISEGTLATPIGKVSSLDEVVRVASEHGVDKIVVGLPGLREEKIKGFGARLAELSGIPVDYIDETFSTRQARKLMIAAGTGPKKRLQEIDQNAAAVILQGYLDVNP